MATSLIFLILIVGMLGVIAAPVTVVPSIQRAINLVQIDFVRVITDIGNF